MTLNFWSSCFHLLGAENNAIGYRAHFLCDAWETLYQLNCSPSLASFEMGLVLSLTTCHELKKKSLSSKVYRDAFVANMFWKSGMSSVMTLYWKTIMCCLSSLKNWLWKQSSHFPHLRPKVFFSQHILQGPLSRVGMYPPPKNLWAGKKKAVK